MSQVADAVIGCPNCGAEMVRAYCAECGQKAGPLNPSIHDLAHEVTHELLHVDGKIVPTVRYLLTRPGFLTREYFDGRRARYVPPLRLYLICSVIYFGALAVMPADAGRNSQFNIEFTPSKGQTVQQAEEELREKGFESQEQLREGANDAIRHWMPQAFFVLVPFFALLVGLVTRGRGVKYPQHLIFALHVHAAAMALAAIGQIAWLIPNTRAGDVLRAIVVFYTIGYLAVALKRVYRKGVAGAIWRTALIVPVYFMAVVTTAAGISLGWIAYRVLID